MGGDRQEVDKFAINLSNVGLGVPGMAHSLIADPEGRLKIMRDGGVAEELVVGGNLTCQGELQVMGNISLVGTGSLDIAGDLKLGQMASSGVVVTDDQGRLMGSNIDPAALETLVEGGNVTMGSGTLVLSSAGNVLAPPLTFSGDLDSGLMRLGPDQVGVAVGGVLVGSFSPAQLTIAGNLVLDGLELGVALGNSLALNDGSAAAPALAFESAPSVGLFMPAQGALGFATAGEEGMRLTSDGRLGVGGNAVPAHTLSVEGNTFLGGTLDVKGSAAISPAGIFLPNSSAVYSWTADPASSFRHIGWGAVAIRARGLDRVSIVAEPDVIGPGGEVTILGKSRVEMNNVDTFAIGPNGVMGIGNAWPTHRLSVDGDVFLKGNVLARRAFYGSTGASTAGLPSFSFAEDTDSGVFSNGADTVGVSTGGATRLVVTSAGLRANVDGTAAAPAYSWLGDTDTGMYRIGADALGFSTGGTEKMRLTSAGRLGLGNTNPQHILSADGRCHIDGHPIGRGANASISTNIAYGRETLHSSSLTGEYNSAYGDRCCKNITSGTENTGHGHGALHGITTGQKNVGIGMNVLYNSTGAAENTVVGSYAMESGTVCIRNTAVGYQAARNILGGNTNTVVGYYALASATTGNDNVAVGGEAMYLATTGIENVGVGRRTLYSLTTGNWNTAVGGDCLRVRVDGTNMTSLVNCSGLGYDARVSGSNQIQLGNAATTTYVHGTVQNRSDGRDKADIRPTTLGLDFIDKLRPVDFKWDLRDSYFDARVQVIAVSPRLPLGEEELELPDGEYPVTFSHGTASAVAVVSGGRVVGVRVEAGGVYDADSLPPTATLGSRPMEVHTGKLLVPVPKDGSRKRVRYHHGVIAQEVKAVVDEMGTDFGGLQHHALQEGGSDVFTVGYDELIGPLIKAVQELSTAHKALQALVTAHLL